MYGNKNKTQRSYNTKRDKKEKKSENNAVYKEI